MARKVAIHFVRPLSLANFCPLHPADDNFSQLITSRNGLRWRRGKGEKRGRNERGCRKEEHGKRLRGK